MTGRCARNGRPVNRAGLGGQSQQRHNVEGTVKLYSCAHHEKRLCPLRIAKGEVFPFEAFDPAPDPADVCQSGGMAIPV